MSETAPDCVFCGRDTGSGWSDLAVDISDPAQNLTAGASWASEANSSRANQTDQRTVNVVFEANGTSSGTLWEWDRGSGDFSRIWVTSSAGDASINITTDGGTTTRTFPLTSSVSDVEFVLAWTMEPDPDSANHRHELHILPVVTPAEYPIHITTLPVESGTDLGSMTFGARDAAGTNTYSEEITEIRLCVAFQSSVSTFETYLDTKPAPTLLGDRREPSWVPDRVQADIGAQSLFAGPTHLMAGRAALTHRSLTWGPLVREAYRRTDPQPDFNADTVHGRVFGLPVSWLGPSPFYKLRIEHLWYRPVPLGANKAVVTLAVRHAASGGSTNAPIEIAALSMSQPGPFVRPSTSPPIFERYRVNGSIPHGGTTRIVLPPLRLAMDNGGWTYLAIAFRPNVENLAFRVRHVTIEPIADDSGDGLGVGGFSA